MDGNDITNVTLESIQWADGVLLVYSITDRQSFNYIKRAKMEIQSDIPVSLVGNKVDMIHLRQVSADEGDILAKDFDCKFSELSAAEHVIQVADAFHDLCREVLCARRKSKQSLLDRMLGGTRVYARGKSDSALPKEWICIELKQFKNENKIQYLITTPNLVSITFHTRFWCQNEAFICPSGAAQYSFYYSAMLAVWVLLQKLSHPIFTQT